MPKLKNKPPKYSKLKQYAVVYHDGKTHYLGLYGSPESKTAYARFVAESRENPVLYMPKEEAGVTVSALAAAFLDYVQPTLDDSTYGQYRVWHGENCRRAQHLSQFPRYPCYLEQREIGQRSGNPRKVLVFMVFSALLNRDTVFSMTFFTIFEDENPIEIFFSKIRLTLENQSNF